jgi:hypothetical protein
MARDVLVVSMDRGQLPVLGAFAVVFVTIWRMPPDELTKFSNAVLDRFNSGALVGWIGFVLTAFGWWWHVRKLLTMHANEVRRIGNEKSAAQDRAAGKPFKGSRPRKQG